MKVAYALFYDVGCAVEESLPSLLFDFISNILGQLIELLLVELLQCLLIYLLYVLDSTQQEILTPKQPGKIADPHPAQRRHLRKRRPVEIKVLPACHYEFVKPPLLQRALIRLQILQLF